MLCYPIMTYGPHKTMVRDMQYSLKDAFTHEVSFPRDRSGHRMIGSGLFVVNAPYGFEEEATRLSALFQAKLRHTM